MKADPVLRRIPVVAISGSSREIDIARAYDGQISAYLIKPTGVGEYFAAIRSLKELWFHAAALPPREEAASTYAGNAKVILVVDDDSQRLARTQQILTEAGYRVLSARSAEEAEALADTTAVFDLIICPVVMEGGGESGVHLAEHIERSKRTNSTLLFSHYSRDLLRHVPGFDRQRHFLSNPFSVEELLRRVRDLLAG
jgi:CheY-like chemotaxis protein